MSAKLWHLPSVAKVTICFRTYNNTYSNEKRRKDIKRDVKIVCTGGLLGSTGLKSELTLAAKVTHEILPVFGKVQTRAVPSSNSSVVATRAPNVVLNFVVAWFSQEPLKAFGEAPNKACDSEKRIKDLVWHA